MTEENFFGVCFDCTPFRQNTYLLCFFYVGVKKGVCQKQTNSRGPFIVAIKPNLIEQRHVLDDKGGGGLSSGPGAPTHCYTGWRRSAKREAHCERGKTAVRGGRGLSCQLNVVGRPTHPTPRSAPKATANNDESQLLIVGQARPEGALDGPGLPHELPRRVLHRQWVLGSGPTRPTRSTEP